MIPDLGSLTDQLVAALTRQEVAEELERRASWALVEADEAVEDTPGDDRVRAARDHAEQLWRDALARLEDARRDREEVEAELDALDPAAVRLAYRRHYRYGPAGGR